MIKDSLVGRWVHLSDEGYYKLGQVILSLGTTHHLVKWRPNDKGGPQSSELVCIDDFCVDESKEYYVQFFDTEEELDAWLAWMNTPSDDKKPKIVTLKPKL